MIVITPEGRIKFASQFFTESVLDAGKEEWLKYPEVFEDVNTFEMYAFEFPDTVRRVRKQVDIIVNREAKFAETRLDFRSKSTKVSPNELGHDLSHVLIPCLYGINGVTDADWSTDD